MENDINGFNPEPIVAEFVEAMECSLDPKLWAGLLKEEIEETVEAMEHHLASNTVASLEAVLKEICDVVYALAGFATVTNRNPEDLVLIMDDLELAVAIAIAGREVFSADDMIEAFERVHLSNMSKLGEDGKPVRREDGKIMKGPNYKPPMLTDIAYRAIVRNQQAAEGTN